MSDGLSSFIKRKTNGIAFPQIRNILLIFYSIHTPSFSMCILDLKYPDDSMDSQSPNAAKMPHCS